MSLRAASAGRCKKSPRQPASDSELRPSTPASSLPNQCHYLRPRPSKIAVKRCDSSGARAFAISSPASPSYGIVSSGTADAGRSLVGGSLSRESSPPLCRRIVDGLRPHPSSGQRWLGSGGLSWPKFEAPPRWRTGRLFTEADRATSSADAAARQFRVRRVLESKVVACSQPRCGARSTQSSRTARARRK